MVLSWVRRPKDPESRHGAERQDKRDAGGSELERVISRSTVIKEGTASGITGDDRAREFIYERLVFGPVDVASLIPEVGL